MARLSALFSATLGGKEAPTMLDILFEWICWAFRQFLLAVVLVPIGVILAGYLVYILLMTLREFRKSSAPAVPG